MQQANIFGHHRTVAQSVSSRAVQRRHREAALADLGAEFVPQTARDGTGRTGNRSARRLPRSI
jgi:hypothetical protein